MILLVKKLSRSCIIPEEKIYPWLKHFTFLFLILSSICRATAGQTEDMTPIGQVKLRESAEIKDNMLGLAIFKPEDVQIARKLGAHFIRIDIKWNSLDEHKKGILNYKECDQIINSMKNANLTGLAILLCGRNKLYDNFLKTDEGMEEWKKFVKKTVSRYKNDISWWEIWNEENDHEVFFPYSNEEYVKLLKESSRIIREIQPDATICMGGTATTDFRFIEKVLKLGAADYIDAVGYHPYRSNPEKAESNEYSAESYEATVTRLRKLAWKYNKKLRIWNTEHGMPSSQPTDGWYFPTVGTSELMQAKYLLRRFILEKSLKIERSVLFHSSDILWGKDILVNTKGIFSTDKKPKLAFFAMQNFSAIFDSSIKPIKLDWEVSALSFHPSSNEKTSLMEIEAETPAVIVAPLMLMKDSAASGGLAIGTSDSPKPRDIRAATGKMTPGDNDEKGYAVYKFQIKEKGNYYIFARAKVPYMSDTSNSFYIQIDSDKEFIWDILETGNKWEWGIMAPRGDNKHTPAFPVVKLDTGEHVLKIRTREDGAMLDKLRITLFPGQVLDLNFQEAQFMKFAFENFSGTPMLCIWKATGIIDWQNVQDATATITIHSDKIKDPVLVDLLSKDHKVYKLNDFDLKNGMIIIRNVPLTDYPMLITDRSAVRLEEEATVIK